MTKLCKYFLVLSIFGFVLLFSACSEQKLNSDQDIEKEPTVTAICGNGTLEDGEACDDNNTVGGDGCSSACLVETGGTEPATPVCGNGILEKGDGILTVDEACEDTDDGNPVSGDGCSATCQKEAGAIDRDSDGYTSSYDCNDSDSSIHPYAEEIASDDIDQDCSGQDKYLVAKIESLDQGSDGTIDQMRTYSYSGDCVTAEPVYDFSEAAVVMTFENTCDEHGNFLSVIWDGDGDPATPDLVVNYVNTYNANGKLTKQIVTTSLSTDPTVLGNSTIRYYYDDAGNLETQLIDNDSNGLIDYTYYYTYDANNRLATQNNTGGLFNSLYTYTYNEAGQLVTQTFDYHVDDVVDDTDTYYYNTDGTVSKKEHNMNSISTDTSTYVYQYSE